MQKFISSKRIDDFIKDRNSQDFKSCTTGFQVGYRDCLLALRDFIKEQPCDEMEYCVRANKKRMRFVLGKERKTICTNCKDTVDKMDSFCKHCGANFTPRKD